MPVWVLSLVSVFLSVGSLICNLTMHVAYADMKSCFISLVFSVLMLVIADNIKKEAGK